MKARIYISILVVMMLVFITPFFIVVGYSMSLGRQYDNTYLAAMADKHNRLESIVDPKIILVGGSNLPFGIDSKIIEEEMGMEVVNFGLYAALGTKTTMDLSKANINKDDIVIVVPELNAQTYSKYIDGKIMLQTLDAKRNMIWDIPVDDWLVMANSYPAYLKEKDEFKDKGKPDPTNAYARNAFNEYGDNVYERPYNIMPDMYDSTNMVTIDKNMVSSDFIEYFNDYVKYAERRGAQVFLSFPPVNQSSLTQESTFEKRLEFYDYTREVFEAEVISNVEDYILHQDYFYDSNYHLNESGVIARTVKLIGDIKRTIGDTSATDIEIPEGSGAVDNDDGEDGEDGQDGEDNNGSDNVLAKDFAMELIGGKYVVTGLSAQGKAKTTVRIPATYESMTVYKIAENAFAGATTLTEIIIPESILVLENGIFDGANNLIRVVLNLNKSTSAILPVVGDNLLKNANSNLKIYVPFIKLNIIKIDYFWAKYSSYIESQ